MNTHLLRVKSDLRRSYLGGLAIFLIFVLVLWPSFNLPTLGGSSEAREAHIARLMADGQGWILPLRNGLIPSKPPLLHWLAAGIIKLTKSDPLGATRFVSLLFGGLTLAVTYLMTFRLASGLLNVHRTDAVKIGLGACLILGTIAQFIGLSGQARVDMPFAFLATLALATLFEGFLPDDSQGAYTPVPSASHFFWFYFLSGWAVLARGPLGIVFPLILAIGGSTWLIGIKQTLTLFIRPRLGWFAFVLVVLPWYLLAYQKGGYQFISRQLLFENIERLTGATLINNQPFWFYIPSFLISCLPWSLVLVFLGRSICRSFTTRDDIYSPGIIRIRQIKGVTLIFVLTGMIFLSLASGKRHSYLLPLLPFFSVFLALHLGVWAAELGGFGRERFNCFVKNSETFICLTTFSVGIFIFLLRYPVLPSDPLVRSIQLEFLPVFDRLAFFLVAMGCVGLWALRSKFIDLRLFVIWAVLAALYGVIFFGGHALRSYLKGYDSQARKVSDLVQNNPLSVVKFDRDESFDAFLYYYDRPVKLVIPDLKAVPCPGISLTSAAWFRKLSDDAQGTDRLLTQKLAVLTKLDQYLGRSDRMQVLFSCARALPINQ